MKAISAEGREHRFVKMSAICCLNVAVKAATLTHRKRPSRCCRTNAARSEKMGLLFNPTGFSVTLHGPGHVAYCHGKFSNQLHETTVSFLELKN